MKSQAEQQMIMMAAMQAQMTGVPPEPPQAPPNPMQNQQKITKGKGITGKMQNAMNPDLVGQGIPGGNKV